MLPSGKIAKNKLMSKAETFQMLIPQNMPGAFIPQFIGKIYVNRAQKLKEIAEVVHIKANKECAYLQVDLSLIERWFEDNAPKYKDGMPLGTSHDTGSGIRLGQSVGGKTDHMNRVTAWRMINPPMAFAQGLVVNKQGKGLEMKWFMELPLEMPCARIMMASLFNFRSRTFCSSKGRSGCSSSISKGFSKSTECTSMQKRKTLQELSKIYNIPEESLADAVKKYNAAARNETSCEFQKL